MNTSSRVGRMLQGLLESGNKKAKIEITVSLFNGDDRRLHQAFRLKTWTGRDGQMVTVDLNDGDWAAGTWATKVAHLNVTTGEVLAARGMTDALLVYAAKAAIQYAQTGTVPTAGNGRVEAVEASLCGCCGRKLTDPVSIDRGIGPECYGKATKAGRTLTARQAPAVAAANVAQATARAARPARKLTPVASAPAVPAAVAVDGKGVPFGAGDWRGRQAYAAQMRADQIRQDVARGECSQDADLRPGSGVDIFGAPIAA